MADGTYRVVRGDAGETYLYFFPPSGGRAAIVLDVGSVPIPLILHLNNTVVEWTSAECVALLDELEVASVPIRSEGGGSDGR
jgi:hypothetical protein